VKTIAFHSYKGGTGKTFLSVNLAALYAQEGKAVCLLDFDFRAPSLYALFDVKKPAYKLNDFLDGKSELESTIIEIRTESNWQGKLYVGFADPTTEAMSKLLTRDRRWQMKALRRTSASIKSIGQSLELDYIILDTSPGFEYSSINALLCSDVATIVTTSDKSDIEGTIEMTKGVYKTLERKTGIIMNKVPTGQSSIKISDEMKERLQAHFKLPMIGMIPCHCDILCSPGHTIFIVENKTHPVVENIRKLSEKIQKF